MRTTIAVFLSPSDRKWHITFGLIDRREKMQGILADRLANGDTLPKHEEHLVRLPRRLTVDPQFRVVNRGSNYVQKSFYYVTVGEKKTIAFHDGVWRNWLLCGDCKNYKDRDFMWIGMRVSRVNTNV